MRARSASILVWSAVGVAGLLEAVSGWLAALNVGTPLPDGIADLAPENGLFQMPAGLAFLAVGALIVARRPSNRIGLVLFGIGLGGAISGFAGQYAVQALLADPGSLPGGPWAAWLRSVTLALFVPIFVFLPLWFPDGRPRRAGGDRLDGWARSRWRSWCSGRSRRARSRASAWRLPPVSGGSAPSPASPGCSCRS